MLEYAVMVAALASGRDPRGEPGRSWWRRRLLEFIRRRPGERLNAIWKAVGANRGTAKYHLLMLARSSEVRILRNGHARYFPAATNPAAAAGLSLLRRGRVLEVALKIQARPGLGQHDLTELLPMSRKVFRGYATLLERSGLVREVREPHARRYFPEPKLRWLLDQLPPHEQDGPDREGLR